MISGGPNRRKRGDGSLRTVSMISGGRGDSAFGYLARYIQKGALDGARIVALTDATVSFVWKDRESGERRAQTLAGEAFLQRFLQHVLPRGFVRTRHFGFLSAAAKARLGRVRALLKAPLGVVVLLPPKPAPLCRCCQQPMTFVHCYRPARGPPRRPPVTSVGTPQS